MSQLRSIAERLRSDNENERATAVSMIERKTGLSITEVIQRGARSHLRGDPQKWVLEHISTKTGDRMIVAVGREIAALKTSWGDIVDAVCEALPILVDGDDAGFMTKVALICPPPKPAGPATKEAV